MKAIGKVSCKSEKSEMINLMKSTAIKTNNKRQFLITAEQEANAKKENTAQLRNFTIAVRATAKMRYKYRKRY